jgi:hypothetical protein
LKSLLQDFVEIQHEVVQDFVESMRWCRFLLKARHVRHQTCSKKLLDSSSKAAEQQLAKLMGRTSPSCLPLRVPPFKASKSRPAACKAAGQQLTKAGQQLMHVKGRIKDSNME